eukprot:TRINITY_DN79_c0_g1_i12.p1 TRINITY_DN79_c0_g1~~TRINITY_DN79_c0_g1_i12.p1  ORF type:complete len:282 (-),score=28.59 TRINITY_DN79_c0_g1_i12:86-931(-)
MLSLQTIFGQFLGDATRSGATVWNTIYTLFSPTKALEYALTTPLQVKRVFILSAVLVPLFLLLILREEGLHSFVEILLSSYRNQDLTILMESIFFGPSLMSWSFEFLVMLIWSIPIFPTIIFVDHNWLQGIFEYMLITFLLFKGLARTFSLLSLVMFFPNVSERLIGHILPHFQFKGALANLFMTLVVCYFFPIAGLGIIFNVSISIAGFYVKESIDRGVTKDLENPHRCYCLWVIFLYLVSIVAVLVDIENFWFRVLLYMAFFIYGFIPVFWNLRYSINS